MKPGDLVFVVRGYRLEGKFALILEVLHSEDALRENHFYCLIEGKYKIIPASWVETINETG